MTTDAQLTAARELARALVASLRSVEWQSLTLVARRAAYSLQITELEGYRYGTDEVEPLELSFDLVDPAFTALIEATCPSDQPGWLAVLFQLENGTGRNRMVFEHDDGDRWRLPPSGWDDEILAMRPDFDAPAPAN